MKQQRKIKRYITDTLPQQDCDRIISAQISILNNCINSLSGKSESQTKMLIGTILPRIALYKALMADKKYSERAYEITRKYLIEVVGAEKHRETSNMEKVPFFYEIYSRAFLKIMKKTDLQKSTAKLGDGYYDVTITDCLWHNACVENGCEELCRAFCEVDDVNYGNLSKLGFSRTQTLGMGGSCCDFHFYKK